MWLPWTLLVLLVAFVVGTFVFEVLMWQPDNPSLWTRLGAWGKLVLEIFLSM